MLCRGFKGRFYTLYEFSLGGRDILLTVILLSGVVVMAILEWA